MGLRIICGLTLFLSFPVRGSAVGKEPAQPAPEKLWAQAWVRHYVLGGMAAGEKQPEAAAMLSAVLNGSRMGPGDGWFGPSHSRYGWAWLSARHDQKKGITAKDWRGPAELFQRLDRDGDGQVTAEDLNWSDNSFFQMMAGLTQQWFYRVDTNSNGRISRQEWEALFAKAAGGKDHLTPEDLRRVLALSPPWMKPAGAKAGPSTAVLLQGLFNGELGSPFEGPRLDEPGPDFTLPTQDGKKKITLSIFRGKKPVVLIFGSFT